VTAPAPSGGPSPLRVGGLALLGVGAIAAVIGIGTLVTGGGGSGSSASPSSTTAAAEPTAGASATGAAPGDTGVPIPSFGPTPTNAIAAPGTAGTGTAGSGSAGSGSTDSGSVGSAGSGGSSPAVFRQPLRVYNNSTIKGLAARAAEDFRGDGWTVDAVANYPYGNIPTSTVYYRPGTSEQAAAEAVGSDFGMRVEPRFAGLDDATPGVIVIVTNDYQKRA
jgi:hypothetical protein